jgi:hypothetical protein
LIPLKTPSLGGEQRRLLDLFDRLGQDDRRTLLAFAEFLAARPQNELPEDESVPETPKAIERPGEESVVAAIRRLSETYFMLDRQDMLNDTAALMGAHVMQSRPASDVIDELEVVFETHYRRYLENQRK